MTQSIISSIGLEKERVGIVIRSKEDLKSLAKHAEEISERVSQLTPSPVHRVCSL
jgi:coenzyme F420-reducing hydrogenase delta subunit